MNEFKTELSKKPGQDPSPVSMQHAGRHAAQSLTLATMDRSVIRALQLRSKAVYRALESALAAAPRDSENGRWLAENARLLRTAERQTRDIFRSLREYPAVLSSSSAPAPRVCGVASAYLDATLGQFSEDSLIAYLSGYQEIQELRMGELWALQPALQLELLNRVTASLREPASYPLAALINSLRHLSESEWKDLFEAANVIEGVLGEDPARYYRAMDYESRGLYRAAISELAKHSARTEHEVADAAVAMAREAQQSGHLGGRAAERRRHIGFYLIDRGLPRLKHALGYKPEWMAWITNKVREHPEPFYLMGMEIMTLLIVYGLLSGLDTLTPVFIGLFLLILPATQAAVDFMNNMVSFLVPPSSLPKLDFEKSIPEDCATMVAVPTLLLSESQVKDLVADLEIRYLANRYSNLYFALVTDSPDSDQPVDERDQLVTVCEKLIERLNERYGEGETTPFYLFHRHRVFNKSEGRWMGWERKRGKLLDLNQMLRGGYDSFPVKVGNTGIFPKVRYIITLDSDTQLPRDCAHRLIGTMAHPLNRAVVDPQTKTVVEGYGILQPRIGVSIQSSSRSWLANIYSGQTGFDIYTRAVSDVYQDLFGEGTFTGKGIYEVDALRESLEHRFPENALLSHDLIEGAYARAGLVSDLEFIDDYPSHFSAYSRRKHRWMRGDWQIMRWIRARVPDREGRMTANPISAISRWKIVDNLRRSLFDPATLLLLLSGWFYLPGEPLFWTAVSLSLLLMPAYSSLLFSLLRAPWGRPAWRGWAKDTGAAFGREHVIVLLHLVFLLQEALVASDAVVRSLARVWLTKRRLLEWETAAEAESGAKKATADKYLDWSTYIAVAVGAALYFLRRPALPVAAPILLLWMSAHLISKWLNSSPRAAVVGLKKRDVALLRSSALRMWAYFRDWSTERTHHTIPDHVRADGFVAERLSPTNLGLLLNARVAAVHFGYLTVPEFVEATNLTLTAVQELPRFRGHWFNWYSTDGLETLPPRFVSTVDSGNLAGCLWALKQAALAMAREQPGKDALWSGIRDTAELIGSDGGAGAAALRDQVLGSAAQWPDNAAVLELAARRFSQEAEGETAAWARELALRFAKAREWFDSGLTGETAAALQELAETAGRLVTEMDFSFLRHPAKKLLSIGYDADADRLEPASYDLLASESRIATFVAIAKGDAPQETWFHLGRRHTLFGGERVLVSWTGTMFEYLMPALWMQHYPGTLILESMQAAVRVQRKRTLGRGVPWGISESACAGSDTGSEYGYAPFGIPELAMKPADAEPRVISPYSTFLALLVDPQGAMENLHRMARLGWVGKYGFYEAVDYSWARPAMVRSWMAHHQGMSLLASCNLLFDNLFQRYFNAEPFVLATELLLHERLPSAVTAEAEELPQPVPRAGHAAA